MIVEMKNSFYRAMVSALCMVFIVCTAEAQYYGTVQEPQLFDWRFHFDKVVMDVRSEQEKRSSTISDFNDSRDLLILAPMIGASLSGSIYHPNLFLFDIEAIEGMSFEHEQTTGLKTQETSSRGSGESDVGSVNVRTTFLQKKPYGGNYTYNRSVLHREYDFFTRVRVENSRHYLRSRCNLWDGFPVSVSYEQWRENVDDLARPTLRREEEVQVNAEHLLGFRSLTRFMYAIEKYDYEEDQVFQNGTRIVGDLSNIYKNDPEGKITLYSSGQIYKLESNYAEYDRLSVAESLSLEHTKKFGTSYSLTYDQNDSGDQDSADLSGAFSASHTLYESLNSTLQANWLNSEVSGEGSSWKSEEMGWGIGESYRKKLGEWGVLGLQAGYRVSDTTRDVTGRLINVTGETLKLQDGQQVLLGYPKVIESSVVVTDKSGKIVYIKNLDYWLINRGSFTEIQRVFAGTIADEQEVLVDYSAESEGSEGYSTSTRYHGVNVSLADGLITMYVNWNKSSNEGAGSLTLQDLNTRIAGANLARDGIQMGVEHQDVESSLIPYTSLRFYQNYFVNIGERSAIRLNMSQRKARYPDLDQEEDVSSKILSYDVRLTRTLTFSFSGGLYDERGRGIEREFKTFRGAIDWRLGLSSLFLDYYVTDEKDINSLRERHALTMRFERVF